MSPATFLKDPGAMLDYVFDWSDWLAVGETISTHAVVAAIGLTCSTVSESGGAVQFWLSGGTAGNEYGVTCTITTSAGRTDQRSMRVVVQER